MTIKPDTQIEEVIRADHIFGPPKGQWTYADYAAIPDDGHHYEVVDGVLYMSPSPNKRHQAVNRWFIYYLTMYIQVTGLGEVFGPPFDVELGPKDTVQPDIIIVLNDNLDISTPSHIVGAPDLVVEIASPGTAAYDRGKKQEAYARAGVKEYWIAEPVKATIEVSVLEQGQYRSLGLFQGQDRLPSQVIPEIPVNVEQFFV